MDKIYDLSEEEKEEIKSIIINNLKKEDRIKFGYIHGSFLKGKFHDIDIAVYIEEENNKKDILDFELEMEVKLSKKLKIPVEIRVMNSAPTHFCYKVIKDGELLFSNDESARSDFESLVLVKHHDFQYYRERYRKEVSEKTFDKIVKPIRKKAEEMDLKREDIKKTIKETRKEIWN